MDQSGLQVLMSSLSPACRLKIAVHFFLSAMRSVGAGGTGMRRFRQALA